jgi:hypothetical protein
MLDTPQTSEIRGTRRECEIWRGSCARSLCAEPISGERRRNGIEPRYHVDVRGAAWTKVAAKLDAKAEPAKSTTDVKATACRKGSMAVRNQLPQSS